MHVSVTTGYQCVDLRMFYQHPHHGPRPSYEGIALRLDEWSSLKELLPQIHKEHPMLTDDYHVGWCKECNPQLCNIVQDFTLSHADINLQTGLTRIIAAHASVRGCNMRLIVYILNVVFNKLNS